MEVTLGGVLASVGTPAAGPQLDAIAALETASYAADEAASSASLAARLAAAPELFLAAHEAANGSLLAFICATRSAGPQLTEGSMAAHDPAGPLVCIHSVVVQAGAQRRGVATALLREYLRRLPAQTAVTLIARAHHVPLYERVGFVSGGPSPVEHGTGTWMEMRMETAAARVTAGAA